MRRHWQLYLEQEDTTMCFAPYLEVHSHHSIALSSSSILISQARLSIKRAVTFLTTRETTLKVKTERGIIYRVWYIYIVFFRFQKL